MAATSIYRLPEGGKNLAAGVWLGAVSTILWSLFLSLWMATQYVAYRFHYHPNLGAPWLIAPRGWVPVLDLIGVLLVVVSVWCLRQRSARSLLTVTVPLAGLALVLAVAPIYNPFAFFLWYWHYSQMPHTESLWWTAELLLAIPSHCAVFLAVVVAVRRAKQLGGKSDLHGSAHWATRDEVAATGLRTTSPAGVYVGGWHDGKRLHYLRHAGPQHVLAFAPSRSGKGVGLVIPTLLTWPHSVLVNDIKGENWALTAGWRKQELGNVCVKFDPTCANDTAARYNPLQEIRDYPSDVRDAQNLADIIIDPEGTAQRDHWDRTARDLITGVILHQLYAGKEKSLTGCFHLLTDPRTAVENTLSKMMTWEHDPQGLHTLIDPVTKKPTKTHPVVAGAARAVLNKSDNERSSVISSALSFLDLYRDPLIARNTSQCDFSIRDLMHHDQPVSLYLTTPPSDLARTKPLLRMLLTQIGTRLTEQMEVANGTFVAPYKHPLLLMLDEFPTLGRLPFMQTALGYLAGYGIKAYLIVQDVAQLRQAYGRDNAILSNCDVRVAYTPNTYDTAKLISDMLGTMTVSKETRTYTGNRLNPVLMHVMASEQESQRPLLTPDEVLRLPQEHAIVFVTGQAPIQGRKMHYYRDSAFAQRAAVRPPATSDLLPLQEDRWPTPPEPTEDPAPPATAPAPPAAPAAGAVPSAPVTTANETGSDVLPATSPDRAEEHVGEPAKPGGDPDMM